MLKWWNRGSRPRTKWHQWKQNWKRHVHSWIVLPKNREYEPKPCVDICGAAQRCMIGRLILEGTKILVRQCVKKTGKTWARSQLELQILETKISHPKRILIWSIYRVIRLQQCSLQLNNKKSQDGRMLKLSTRWLRKKWKNSLWTASRIQRNNKKWWSCIRNP